MRNYHELDYTLDTGEEEWDVTLRYAYSPGCPETPPAYAHGGLPAEPPEVELLAVYDGQEDIISSLSQAQIDAAEQYCFEHRDEGDDPDYDPDPCWVD